MNKANTRTVFISYADVDEGMAKKLDTALRKRGLKTWLKKEKLLPGHKIDQKVQKAIKDATCCLFLLSKKSISQSGAFHKELNKAQDNGEYIPADKVYLIPVLLEEVESIPDFLEGIQPLDLRDAKKFDQEIDRLVESLEVESNSEEPPTSPWPNWLKILLSIMAVILIAGLYCFLSPKEKPDCLFEEDSNYHILLLPITELTTKKQANYEEIIITRLDEIAQRDSLKLIIKNYSHYESIVNPLKFKEVRKLNETCKADLNIWGGYVKEASEDSIYLNIRYLSHNRYNEDFLYPDEEAIKGNIKSKSALLAGELTAKIEAIVYWALGIKAYHEEDFELALRRFEEMGPLENSESACTRYAGIAECYLMMNEYEEALKHYKSVLERNPKNLLALFNKAVIFVKMDSVEAANRVLEEAKLYHPEDGSVKIFLSHLEDGGKLDALDIEALNIDLRRVIPPNNEEQEIEDEPEPLSSDSPNSNNPNTPNSSDDVSDDREEKGEKTIPLIPKSTLNNTGVVKTPDIRSIFEEIKKNMELVEGGIFTMGCKKRRDEDCSYREKPTHKVRLSSYYLSKYEVTNAEYAAFLNAKGDGDIAKWINLEGRYENEKCRIIEQKGIYKVEKGYDDHPVIYVSWYGAAEFCKWLSEETGNKYRLPTEAEWEYAARGGKKSKADYHYSGSNDLDKVGWYYKNSGDGTHPVGKKKANELGLYDMSGNVLEWCSDRYGDYDKKAKTNPTGPNSGSGRVLRGGGWGHNSEFCAVSFRYYLSPEYRSSFFSLRLARSSGGSS